MKGRIMRPTSRIFALACAGVLTLSACGGSGFDDGADGGAAPAAGETSGGGDGLTMLIASSGDAETNAVK